MRNIGLIGCGAIGTAIIEMWPEHLEARERLAAVLVRPQQISSVTARVQKTTRVTASLEEFMASSLDVVIEAAGHGAVLHYAESLLESGCEFHVLSVGALADPSLRSRLEEAAKWGKGRIAIPAGALAGFDGLLSMRAAGLISVKYTSVKPVEAWRGTPAERACRLQDLVGPQVIFEGTASEAAKEFPRNANLAAAVALAGIGFERTRVELIADPRTCENSGRIEAVSTAAKLDLTLVSSSFSENPKTSRITAMSAIAALQARTELICFC
jgi:aspartate dehydrogenase